MQATNKEPLKMKQLIALALALTVGTAPAIAHEGSKATPHSATARKEQKPWGIAGNARGARTIEIVMTDNMRFTPDKVELRRGDTVKFVVRNAGQMLHEFVIGTPGALDEHAALMVRFPGMEHDEPYMAHVAPGKTGEVVWTFNRAGEFRFACLIAGHYQAGMVGTITVKERK